MCARTHTQSLARFKLILLRNCNDVTTKYMAKLKPFNYLIAKNNNYILDLSVVYNKRFFYACHLYLRDWVLFSELRKRKSLRAHRVEGKSDRHLRKLLYYVIVHLL